MVCRVNLRRRVGHIVLDRFLKKVWNFYRLLKKYKEDPTEKRRIYVKRRFNLLFSTKTGYGELDRRIASTKRKETELMRVLDYPTIENVRTRNFLVLLFSVVTDDNPPSMQKSRDCAASCRDKRSR